ncbi:MAG: LysM peptidoglycan-binding domain-containing protein [Epsilonproteobacteria bacterium]|nr:LysM peptidoglycan-binding domain-containing protein [Campylobacterota bacterium]
MKKIYAVLFVLSASVLSAQAAVKTTKHKIKNGETLYTIAHKNHTTIAEVRKANGLKKGERLKIGRVLTVPKNTYFPNKKKSTKIAHKTAKKKTTHRFAKHSVKNGETLYVIAHKNHTTIAEVRKANGLKKGERLKIGRVLKVPTNTYSPNKKKSTKIAHKTAKKKTTHRFTKHSIKKGETLYTIAHKNHTTIAEVRKANGLKKGETLKIGRVLKVPTNTYHVPKTKLAKTTHKNKKTKVARVHKKNNKKLVASLSNLETISLEKGTVTKKEKKTSLSLGDLLFSTHSSSISKSSKIISLAKKKLGRRYVWGATGEKNTFDCSGFTKYVYKKNGIKLPRRAIAQSKYGKYVPRKNLKKGDLIFFDTSKHRKGYVNHVGIYLGNGKFIHASSAKKKVVITSLNKRFYSQRYKGARRPS